MSFILHIETATKVCSVALSKDERLLAYEEVEEGMNHAALLAPMIVRLLESQKFLPKELDAVSVSSGPGSYTGLRVGGSTAKAIALTLNIPLISIPTLKALASAALLKFPDALYALPMIDARRDEVYTALFDRQLNEAWTTRSTHIDQEFSVAEFNGPIICCGDGAFKLTKWPTENQLVWIDENIKCSARHLVEPVFRKLQLFQVEDKVHFVPDYLKPPNITQPRKSA